MKKVIKLINGEILIGTVESAPNVHGVNEVLIKQPYTAIETVGLIPYCVTALGSAPAAVQIHPMNILWVSPLEDFPEANKTYIKATSGIEVQEKPSIVI